MEKRMSLLMALSLAVMPLGAAWAQGSTGSSLLKAVGQAAVQTAVQALSPQAQAVVDEAQKLGTPAAQENFIVAKAKTFMGEKNYDLALQLANYVLTNINSNSLNAQKIVTDAKASLAQYAQDKVGQAQAQSKEAQQAQQVQSDAAKTAEGVKGLLGAFGTKK